MSKEEIIISGSKIKFKGTFDLSLFYDRLREWLMREKYSDPCHGGERKYAEKMKPNGKQVEILWESSRASEAGYFKILIKVSFLVVGLNEVDVDKNGKKIKLDNGEIELIFNSSLIRNAEQGWDEGGLMFRLYERYIIKEKIEEHKIKAYKDTNLIIDEVKNFFNLYRF